MLQVIKDEFDEIAFPMLVNNISIAWKMKHLSSGAYHFYSQQQIGYEPIPPRQTTLFRKPALALPNIFQYIRYIKSVDGVSGCYRGLVPKLYAYTVGTVEFKKTSKCIKFNDKSAKDEVKCPQRS